VRRTGTNRCSDVAHDLVPADTLLVEQPSPNLLWSMRHEKENRRDCLFAPIRLVGIPLGHPPDAHSDLSKPGRTFFAALSGQAVEGAAEYFEGRDGCGYHGAGRCVGDQRGH